MAVYYCIIARDSDMVVFENLVNKDLKQSQLKDTIVEIIGEKEEQKKEMIEFMFSPEYNEEIQNKAKKAAGGGSGDVKKSEAEADADAQEGAEDNENPSTQVEEEQEEEDPRPIRYGWLEALPTITGGCELHLQLQTGVFFGIVTELKYNEDKAQNLLDALHSEMGKLYKGNLQFIARQGNLKPNVYDKVFKASFNKVLDNFKTGIESKNLNAALAKADEVKMIAARSVDKMNQNLAETEKLLEASQDINALAQDFQKNAVVLEEEMKNQSWWYCSKPCVTIFGSIGALVVLAFIILKLT